MNPQPDYVGWAKDFFTGGAIRFVKGEVDRVKTKGAFRTSIKRARVEFDRTYIFEDFDSEESFKEWRPLADSNTFNGFSYAEVKRSVAGHCLFTGVVDNRLPEDGVTQKSGFTCLIGPKRKRYKLVQYDPTWDWSLYNTLEIKLRGDGRRYTFVINTAERSSDISWYDNYSFHIHTRGGPYWQTVRIPFQKFVFVAKGFVQDEQFGFPPFRVQFVAFALQDGIDGPFSLEIDHIGLRKEFQVFNEKKPYEGYAFSHMKYRELQVDCDPPDRGLG